MNENAHNVCICFCTSLLW